MARLLNVASAIFGSPGIFKWEGWRALAYGFSHNYSCHQIFDNFKSNVVHKQIIQFEQSSLFAINFNRILEQVPLVLL